MNFYERALQLRDELIENRRYLHSNAETGLHMPLAKAFVSEKLKEYGYINDERFAKGYAESLIERKGMSIRGVKSELIRKGISHEIVDFVTDNLDIDPILRIIDLLNTKYKRNLSDEKGIRKTVASLQRLGYRWSDINSALRQIEVETEECYDV